MLGPRPPLLREVHPEHVRYQSRDDEDGAPSRDLLAHHSEVHIQEVSEQITRAVESLRHP
jgi:hypothetical protein